MREVKRYLHKYEADLAKSRLEAEGIRAEVFVDNEGNMAPYLSYGTGARLHVAESDLHLAHSILAEENSAAGTTTFAEEGGRPPLSPDQLATYAFRAALIGLVLLPGILHVVSAFYLVRLLHHPHPVSGSHRQKAWIAFAINIATFAVLVKIFT